MVSVTLGVFDYKKKEPGSVTQTLSMSAITIHPGFKNTSANDIALLRNQLVNSNPHVTCSDVHLGVDSASIFHALLKNFVDTILLQLPKKVVLSDHIAQVCISRNDSRINKKGKKLVITGWGRNNNSLIIDSRLNQVVVLVQPADQEPGCKSKANFMKDLSICAGGVESVDKGFCKGDSGGALVRKNRKRNKWFQYGISSELGDRWCGGDPNKSDVYTRVAHYCDWIDETTGKNTCRPKKKVVKTSTAAPEVVTEVPKQLNTTVVVET